MQSNRARFTLLPFEMLARDSHEPVYPRGKSADVFSRDNALSLKFYACCSKTRGRIYPSLSSSVSFIHSLFRVNEKASHSRGRKRRNREEGTVSYPYSPFSRVRNIPREYASLLSAFICMALTFVSRGRRSRFYDATNAKYIYYIDMFIRSVSKEREKKREE